MSFGIFSTSLHNDDQAQPHADKRTYRNQIYMGNTINMHFP
jgi:hypothetical protein